MSGEHECARPGCTVVVPGYMLACRADWNALPPPLRIQIVRAWQLRRRHPNVWAHLDLVTEAMETWASLDEAARAVVP